jgi:hypothetical protein
VRWFRRWPMYQRTIVNLLDGRAFDGVFFRYRGPRIELRDAQMLTNGTGPVAIDGSVLIERQQIAFIQVHD